MDDIWRRIITDAFGIGWILSGTYIIGFSALLSFMAASSRRDLMGTLLIVVWLVIAAIAFIVH